MRSLSAMSKDLASWPPMRSWRVPTRALPGQVQRPRIHSAVIGHRRQVRGPVGGRPAAPGSGLSFGLIHSRPQTFTGDRGHPVRAGHEHRRTVVNGGAQYSKACEGASLPWVQIPPPPLLTCKNTDPGSRQAGALVLPWPHLVVSVTSRVRSHRRAQPEMSCLVTAIADDPEQRHARRRSAPGQPSRDRRISADSIG